MLSLAVWYIYAADIWSAAGLMRRLNGTARDGVRLKFQAAAPVFEKSTRLFSPTEKTDITLLNLRWNSTPQQTMPLVNILAESEQKKLAHASVIFLNPQQWVKDECVDVRVVWLWACE